MNGADELDHPGTTFYIDEKGARFELVDLRTRLTTTTGTVSSAVASSSGYVSAGIFLKIFRFFRGSPSVSVSGSNRYSTSIALFDRSEIRTDEPHTRAALRTLDPSLLDAQNTYFIIRDVQLARRMRVIVDKGIAGAFGGEASFGKLFSVGGATAGRPGDADGSNPIVAAQDGSTYTIEQTFSKPLTICFLAQQFTLSNVVGGAGGSIKNAALLQKYYNPSATK